MSAVTQDILILILIFGILMLGLDLIVGYARIFSINQALLFGVGAFSYAYCVKHLHTANLLAAAAIAIAIASALSAFVALVSLRISGDYFIVASFGVQLIGLQAIYNWQDVSGGASGVFGLPFPTVFGWQPSTLTDYLLLAFVVCVLVYGAVSFLLLSPYGKLMRALGQDESALAAAGFNPLRLKVSTFVLGGALAAIAGVLYGGYVGIAQQSDFSLSISISLLAMVIVGGAGRMVGGLLGACFLELMPHLLQNLGISSTSQGPAEQAIFGGLLVAVILFLPSGLSGAGASLVGLVRGRRQLAPPVNVVDRAPMVEAQK
jgi:branched-chain amino acid transport system permease protein